MNPAFITFSPSSKLFTISTSNIQYKGTYIIEVLGNLIDGATATISFKLDINNPCENSIVTTTNLVN